MLEAPTQPQSPPDPALQATALRYAAGELPPADAAAFESRLAADQQTPTRTAAAPRPGRHRSRPAVAPEPQPAAAQAPADEAALKTAEIWAELSTPDHVERAHDEELRRRQRLRDWHLPHAYAQ